MLCILAEQNNVIPFVGRYKVLVFLDIHVVAFSRHQLPCQMPSSAVFCLVCKPAINVWSLGLGRAWNHHHPMWEKQILAN